MREAELWKKVSHPNMAKFYGFAFFEDGPALVGKWYSNGCATQFLEQNPEADRFMLV
jgi:serine/threonine protein kinase